MVLGPTTWLNARVGTTRAYLTNSCFIFAEICPSLFDTPTTKVTCSYNNAVIEDCTQAVEGTIAKFRCSPFYENPQLENRPFRICTSGTWDEEQPYCQAGKRCNYNWHILVMMVTVCGKLPISSTNSTLDEVLMPRNYPWQVALFAKYTADHFFASGTLLSRNIVLTGKIKFSLYFKNLYL